MKLRITPLNIIMAIAVFFLAFLWFGSHDARMVPAAFNYASKLLLGILLIVCFVSDMIFRFAIKDLKRIWLIELVFIVLAWLFFQILQK